MRNQVEQLFSKIHLLHVQQVHEGWELLGFETRNKYRILDENEQPLAYAAEVRSGLLGSLLRLVLKHWRSFEINIYDNQKQLILKARFPFRWFFKTLILEDAQGKKLGHLEQRFAIFSKKFDLYDHGRIVGRISSGLFKMWTFDVMRSQSKVATIKKNWSGAISEFFTDKDNFVVTFQDQNMQSDQKALIMTTTLMIDIVYFENNKGSSLLDLGN
jgi:uncharacterized protein YxjI